MSQRLFPLAIAASAAFIVCACAPAASDSNDDHADVAGPARMLDQGADWARFRELFYDASQGSRLIPRDWFVNLEQPDSEQAFSDPAYLSGFGILTRGDKLPIGFAVDADDQAPAGDWVGFTCAACHTGQFTFEGKAVRVDGAPSLADYNSFERELARAATATVKDPAKLERFVKRVGDRQGVREELAAYAVSFSARQKRSDNPGNRPGNGRLDAFTILINEITCGMLNEPANCRVPIAPASMPFLWLAPHEEWVQWNGSVHIALARNVGEAMGVYGQNRVIVGADGVIRIESSVDLDDLVEIESWIKTLQPPRWPEDVLPRIDHDLAAAGERIYLRECEGCHARPDAKGRYPMTADDGFGQYIAINTVDRKKIGTDRTLVETFLDRRALAGVFEDEFGLLDFNLRGEVLAGRLFRKIENKLIDQYFVDNGISEQEQLSRYFDGRDRNKIPGGGGLFFDFLNSLKAKAHVLGYKHGPLAGVAFTAPYLHNGSVPNLRALLEPSTRRPRSFFVGNRELDPVNVGYVSTEGPFELHTHTSDGKPVQGNDNAGHEFGTKLPDQDKLALIEFMKTL